MGDLLPLPPANNRHWAPLVEPGHRQATPRVADAAVPLDALDSMPAASRSAARPGGPVPPQPAGWTRAAGPVGILVLTRHGQSEWNLQNRFTGWTDVGLTPLGRCEARAAGRKLAGLRFDKAYTSNLSRAQDTLKIMLQELGCEDLPTERSAALNERHYGDLQGLNKAETARKLGAEYVRSIRRGYRARPPNGESLEDTAKRTLPYLKQTILEDVRAGRDVLVVAHGNSLRSIVMHLDRLSEEEIVDVSIPTAIPIVYRFNADMSVASKRVLDDAQRAVACA